ILGGAVCSFTPTDSLPQCLRYEVSDRLRFITVIPPYEVHTSEARKVVPQEIPLSTAVWQMGRIAGMTRGLESGNLDLIAAANDDRIQEPYRRRLIPDYNAVRDTCLNGGAKTIWISGSGSTLMAVTDDTIVAKFLQVKLREQFPKCDTHILTCDTEGAQIEYLYLSRIPPEAGISNVLGMQAPSAPSCGEVLVLRKILRQARPPYIRRGGYRDLRLKSRRAEVWLFIVGLLLAGALPREHGACLV
ncbi:MAG: homoserine kinase, partial [Collinsella sp.]